MAKMDRLDGQMFGQDVQARPRLGQSVLGKGLSVVMLAATVLASGAALGSRSGDGRPVAIPAAAPQSMPIVELEPVVIRPTAQQLAEVERIRQARGENPGAALAATPTAGARF